MFRLLMPHTPGKEADNPARFPENQRLEYYPPGGDFLREQSLTLPVRPLPYLRGVKKARHAVPDNRKRKVKKELRKRNGGQPKCLHLPLCPVSTPRRLGANIGNCCLHLLPLRRARKIITGRHSLPTSEREKSAWSTLPAFYLLIGYGRQCASGGLFAPRPIFRAYLPHNRLLIQRIFISQTTNHLIPI